MNTSHLFPIETTIRNASKGANPDRKTTPMVSEIKTKQSTNEENLSIVEAVHASSS
jgi:hypothetical protein